MSAIEDTGGTFLYFGYGSNLSSERIHVNNPSAREMAIARLDDYILDFNFRSQRWNGAVATIKESPGKHVWGVLWELENQHLQTLDDQEGVKYGVYKPLNIQVQLTNGERIQCRSYQLLIHDNDDPRPSVNYKNVILKGAREHGLPSDYIQKLEAIEDNGYEGDCDINDEDEPIPMSKA